MKRLLSILFICCSAMSFAATPTEQADSIVVLKAKRELQLLRSGKVIRTYKVALGADPVGHKQRQGDGRTPEGTYKIDYRNSHSQFHRSLHITYPNSQDRASAKKRGVSPGGDIFIHGLGKQWGWVGKAHTARDWTLGCIAVTNEEIEEIWTLVPDGISVEIRP